MLVVDQLRKDDRRLRALAVVVCAGMVVLLVGLWFVQVVNARHYQASLVTQTFRTVRIPAIRGKILDRNGQVLAENLPSYNLELYIEELRSQFDQEFTRIRAGRRLSKEARAQLRAQTRFAVVSNTVSQAAQVLQQPIPLSERQFRRHHDQWPYRPMPVMERLDATNVARFLEQGPATVGLDLEVQPIRYYPYGAAVAHVLGYVARDDEVRNEEEGEFNYSLPGYAGTLGLEFACDKELAGRSGVKSIVVNSLCYRESETVWTPAEPGKNVYLTLDVAIQKAAAEALRSAGSGVRGAAVVLDAQNGDVLGLASSPTYDPNEWVSGLTPQRMAELNDPKLRPMLNRATQGAYPPGSTFKMITTLACFETGVLNDSNLTNLLNNPGYYMLGARRIKDTASPGYYDFRRAFIRSSNTYFIHWGLKAGRDRLLELARRFHLGQRFGLPTRQEVGGDVPQPEDVQGIWNEGNTANLCIGQEITVTPLQMAVATAAVANGGRIYRPRLVERIEPAEPRPEGPGPEANPSVLLSEVGVQPRYLQNLREAMRGDVEDPEGTGHSARVPGLNVCGKTGTAQITKGGAVVDHITWFASFAPYESPRYVVVVMIESGGSGGGTCAPLARHIYQAIQKQMRPTPPAPMRVARTD